MNNYTNIYKLPINDVQKQSLDKLRSYGVGVPEFIRQAIREKLQREWPSIQKIKKHSNEPSWLYD